MMKWPAGSGSITKDGDLMKLLKYRVIREQPDGSRGKRAKYLYRWSDQEQLHVGGLYVHLGSGYPGLQRVLSVEETENEYNEE